MRLLEAGDVAEIVFVDDGSSDDTNLLARRFPIRVLQSGGQGPGAARNVGWRAARGALIWFVDSDCIIESGALGRLRSRLDELGAAAVGGSYASTNSESLTARLIHHEMVVRHRRIGTRSSFAITANLLVDREALVQLEGFDEALKLAQDLDFAYRLLEAGLTLGFAADSRVAHHHETRLAAYLYKQGRQGYWRMQLYRKHPKRMSGDSYSGLIDYAQPPLALLSLLGAVLGSSGLSIAPTLAGAPLALSAGSLGLVVLLQLPMAKSLAGEQGTSVAASYVGFGTLRAFSRGIGMALGLLDSRPPLSCKVSRRWSVHASSR